MKRLSVNVSYIWNVLGLYTSDTYILKAINLQIHQWLYLKLNSYAKERGIPLVGAIRLILAEFFKNKPNGMDKNGDMPDGIIDMGEGKGLLIDMEKLRDQNGLVQVPPSDLSKEQTIEWIRNRQFQTKTGL